MYFCLVIPWLHAWFGMTRDVSTWELAVGVDKWTLVSKRCDLIGSRADIVHE